MIKNILIVKGGKSAEAEVSRKTAANVEVALKQLGYNVMQVEAQDNLITFLNNNNKEIDVIFNALHGVWGEDGKIQGLFEYFNIPYTHSGVSASAIGMNKFLSKSIFFNNDINVPKGKIINVEELITKEPFKRPFILKPVSEGSSLGIKLIKEGTEIVNLEISNKLQNYLVEEYIPGNDFTVAVMDGKAIGIMEVVTENEIYDYDYKYKKNKNIRYVFPKDLEENIELQLIKFSEKAFKLLNCNGIARVDFRINIKSQNKKVYLLEINTQPGLTENSLFPKIAKNAGMTFPDLINWVVKGAGLNK